jgi:hypothetical protein
MKLPLVRFTVRRIVFTATVIVARFGGFVDPSRVAWDGVMTVASSELALGTPVVTLPVASDDQKKAPAANPDDARRAQIKEYYPRWVGVRAPELGPEGRDHDGKPVTLSSFRGKRMLLFSFDAGNFNRPPDEKALLANLRALDQAIKTVGREKLVVVGFTQGMQFIWPRAPRPDGELGKVSDFPMVSSIPTAIRKFNEPYNLLLEPGAILIDSKGILRAFFDHPMTDRELLDALALTDWDKPVRPNPVEDPWSGKGPPTPMHTAAVAWSRTLPGVVGMTGGDWDLRGSDDLIVAATGKLHVLDPVDGKERHMFPNKDIDAGLTYTLGWARVGKEKSAVFTSRFGWPDQVPVIGRDGAALWKLEKFPDGVDSVAWADLDGAGEKTLIIGFNGGGGLATFVDGGRKRWSLVPEGNIWTVAGIDAIGGRPGLVIFSNGEKVSVVDAKGRDVGTILTDGHYVNRVAASEMDGAGERQVVSVWPANVGTADYAVATDLKGNVLWRYPVSIMNFNKMGQLGPEILAVDVTGDGTKEWITSPNWRELVVLDPRGHLVARIEATDKGFPAWTAIARKGKPGWIVAVEADKLSAFSLAPKN